MIKSLNCSVNLTWMRSFLCDISQWKVGSTCRPCLFCHSYYSQMTRFKLHMFQSSDHMSLVPDTACMFHFVVVYGKSAIVLHQSRRSNLIDLINMPRLGPKWIPISHCRTTCYAGSHVVHVMHYLILARFPQAADDLFISWQNSVIIEGRARRGWEGENWNDCFNHRTYQK